MNPSWTRPMECDSWKIVTYRIKLVPWKYTYCSDAYGYHGYAPEPYVEGISGYGSTPAKSEAKCRRAIKEYVQANKEYEAGRNLHEKEFNANDV